MEKAQIDAQIVRLESFFQGKVAIPNPFATKYTKRYITLADLQFLVKCIRKEHERE